NILTSNNRLFAQNAPVLLLAIAKINHAHGFNRHALHDLGLAVSNFSLQATDFGLGLHQMAGFDMLKAREVFSIPEEFEPVTVIAVGYPGNPETLPEALKQKEALPRKRKPFEELVFDETWNQPSSLFLKKEFL
ncbi:nitroreductase family protein, partial [bacterium]|nr:nitroreductase family protein [bacterium]